MGILKSWFGAPDIDLLLARRDADKLVKALWHKDIDVRARARQALVDLQRDSETNETVLALLAAVNADIDHNEVLFDIIAHVEITDPDLLASVLLNTIEELTPQADQAMYRNSSAGMGYAAAIGFRGRLLMHLGRDAVPQILRYTDSHVIGTLANGLLENMGLPAVEVARELAAEGETELARLAQTFLDSKWANGDG